MALSLNGTSGISGVDGSAGTPALQGSDTNTGISFGADTVNINTGGTTRATVDSSGRVLVGTSSAQGDFTLQIQGDAASAAAAGSIYLRRGLTTAQIGGNVGADLGSIDFGANDGTIAGRIECLSDATWSSTSDTPGRLVFSVTRDGAASPTEALRIKNTGDIIIAASSIATPTPDVETTGFYSDSGYAAILQFRTALTSNKTHVFFRNGNGQVGSITTNASATAYNTSSDYRLKENITAVTDGITRLQQLKPSRFNFIVDPDKTVDGFLAHEVQAVVPEAITGDKDAVDEDGNPVYQGIDQSKLVPLLTAALQEAIAKIESLETRLTALEGGAAQ